MSDRRVLESPVPPDESAAGGPGPGAAAGSGGGGGAPTAGPTPTHGSRLPAPRTPASWTLQTKLLATLLALLAVTSLVIGTVTVLALSRFLLDRLDDQVASAGGRLGPPGSRHAEPFPGDGDSDRFGPAVREGILQARVAGATAYGTVLSGSGTAQALSTSAAQRLAAVRLDGRPHTVDLGGSLGDYRVIGFVATDPFSGTDRRVVGLPLAEVRSTVFWVGGAIGVITLVGLAGAGFAGSVIIRRTLRPLERVAATAGRVAELPLHRGEVALAVRVPDTDTDPTTEVGRVGAALNRMLGHVAAALAARQRSESQVRQFVADASHELRTPLAGIRGYAELARRSREPIPDDIAHALRRIEAESTRMTGLVDDLLLLARLDAGRPVESAPVDLTRIVVDSTGDAHVAGPAHRWHLDLPDEPVTVVGDAHRLHQVVANLLANARTHTPAGTSVTISLRSQPAPGGTRTTTGQGLEAVLQVRDDGPGIAPALLPDVFERFARGDSSRSRAMGSTGLGLSIVKAVVTAHGGTVCVDSEPGRTEFTIRLPLAPDVSEARSGEREPSPIAG